jgi:hypothetical protein
MILSAAVLLLQLSVVQQSATPRIGSVPMAEAPTPANAESSTQPASSASNASPELTTLAMLRVPNQPALLGPFEPGRLTPTPVLAAAAEPMPEPAAAAPAEPAAFIATPTGDNRVKLQERRNKRIWLALAIAQNSSATFDAWTTRRVISSGEGHETDPLLRPFASNDSLYAVIQVAPVALEYLSWRMMHSDHQWERRTWWMPQAAGAVMNLASGVHNLGVH